jgi:hypothetical protein
VSALDRNAERNLPLRPRRDLGKLDLDACRDIRAAPAAHAAADPEEVVAEERGEEIGQAAEIERARLEAATAQAGMPEAVVQLAPLGVRKHLVGFDDLPEAMLGIRRLGDVGMELTGEPAERAFDVVCSRVACDAEQFVIVALGAQLSSYTSLRHRLRCRRSGRAGRACASVCR